jgi:hypothetical protein
VGQFFNEVKFLRCFRGSWRDCRAFVHLAGSLLNLPEEVGNRTSLRCLANRRGGTTMTTKRNGESGRVGYLVLYLMGVPVGLLILMWVLLGNNIFGPG